MTRPKVLAYYFPNYHVDPRNESWFGPEWTEWDLVRNAKPRFPGHQQPRVPQLGYQDESDPDVAASQIALAAAHGIDGFIFDYYWYEDGPFLDGALDSGFLSAENNQLLEFSLMWANHDYVDLFPSKAPDQKNRLLQDGRVSREGFASLTSHVIEKYFSRPNYSTINGRPRFSIYEFTQFIQGIGGEEQAREALAEFDEQVRAAGFPGVHIDAVVWGAPILPSEQTLVDPSAMLERFNVASLSSYVWIHHTDASSERFPQTSGWEHARRSAFEAYHDYARTIRVPFHPNVTTGWDSSPRCDEGHEFERGEYPWFPVWARDLEQFRAGLIDARDFCEEYPLDYREVTINAWNEWTEGSYLLPDTVDGMSFLEAVREVFGPQLSTHSA